MKKYPVILCALFALPVTMAVASCNNGGDGSSRSLSIMLFTTSNRCIDTDGDGFGVNCDPGPDCDDDDPAVNPDADEECDNIDNNCDGVIDGFSMDCYDGSPETQHEGLCHGGHMSCTAGVWGPCLGQVLPIDEFCDYLDNDCDGSIDEGCS